MKIKFILFVVIFAIIAVGCSNGKAPGEETANAQIPAEMKITYENSPVVAPDVQMKQIATGFAFIEGPVWDGKETLYFTDLPLNTIHKMTPNGNISSLTIVSGMANGLAFEKDGNLAACLGGDRMVVSIDMQGNYTVITDRYNNKRYNSCNDLWIDPKGGIYFSDPSYPLKLTIEQDSECVYYIAPDRSSVTRVIGDMKRPNGLVGTPDGKLLYVTDEVARKVYRYNINPDGTLSGKELFAPEGIDGSTIDSEGNIYLTTNSVAVYDPAGNKIEEIKVPEIPANVCFGGPDKKTLYITARTSLYSIRMKVPGL